ncbi:MAG: septum formation protein Maf [Clostridia bacterium]|nr:septum formation protein Maf [Clostridia bacterium]
MRIILASASPRRSQLLSEAGVDFEVIPSEAEERADKALPPQAYTESLARFKAEDVYAKTGGVVLGADTVVVLDGKVLGKPTSEGDARATLRALSGRRHEVITGFCVIYGTSCKKIITDHVVSGVVFNELSDSVIEEYVASGLPMDKAGSYGVQDGYPLVKEVQGSLTNVIGLPVDQVLKVLKEIENGR